MYNFVYSRTICMYVLGIKTIIVCVCPNSFCVHATTVLVLVLLVVVLVYTSAVYPTPPLVCSTGMNFVELEVSF